jgi:hypothetical protein
VSVVEEASVHLNDAATPLKSNLTLPARTHAHRGGGGGIVTAAGAMMSLLQEWGAAFLPPPTMCLRCRQLRFSPASLDVPWNQSKKSPGGLTLKRVTVEILRLKKKLFKL